MKKTPSTKKELNNELARLKRRVADLESRLAEHGQGDAELRYEKLTEASLDGIVVTERGVIVEADENIAELTQRKPSELVGLEFEMLVAGGDSESEPNDFKGRRDPVRSELLSKDGGSVPVEISSMVLSEKQAAAVRVIRDLRPLISAENKLGRIEDQFRAVFESVPDLIYLKDERLRLTHINPAMEEFFGLSKKELMGSSAEDLFGKQAADQIRLWDERVLAGEIVQEEHTRSVNGESRTFHDIRAPLRDANGDVRGVCCVSRDITDYRRAVPEIPPGHDQYRSGKMRKILDQASKIASTAGTILLLGESGSGKDFLAKWIHDHSKRSEGPYFSLNCAALTPELAESELFGHESGAFTGARGRKRGMLELAEGGTLLLNEIGELPLALQSKLLTFLDTMSFVRVGGEKSVTVNARLLAATHRDLIGEVEDGRFLEPLYFRLNVFSIRVPPLRERIEDLPALVDQILSELAGKMHLSQIPRMDTAKLEGLSAYNWPGNVRELKNALERALILWDGGPFEVKLPASVTASDKWSADLPFSSGWTLREVTDEITKTMCIEALRRTSGNKKEASKILGVSRDALYRYIKRFKIDPDMLT